MDSEKVDVLVVGSGPGGSAAAYKLARGGARVALVDKASFPRDKACGDLVGPRGLQVLSDLGIALPEGRQVGDMVVVGPSGRRVHLPSAPGLTYPGHGQAVPRTVLDGALRRAALEAGARDRLGLVTAPVVEGGRLVGLHTSAGARLRADVIIGADGATSRVARVGGLVDAKRVLWGFALRGYVDQEVALPVIAMWEPARWQAFPGYGWAFPGEDGRTNVGLGVATGSDRSSGAAAARALGDFTGHLVRLGILSSPAPRTTRLGGWLKLGMVGTLPARDNVLLVGDAAGLVNPLQGEGIAQALWSGMVAAEAVLDDPSRAAHQYRRALARRYLPYQRATATVHHALVHRPMAMAVAGRLLTAPGLGRALAGGWAVYWNDLLEGAPANAATTLAALASRAADVVTSRGRIAGWFTQHLGAT